MSSTAHVSEASDPLLDELDGWLADNWDPNLTVGEWWERLGLAGWSAPSLPEGSFGRGLPRADGLRVQQRIAASGALGAPAGLGLLLAAPTIASHGTREQIDRYVGDIVTGRQAWCQLFSEPSAGSDLAGLQTRAVKDGDEWIVNGQKVWTSGGQYADLGMLLARTDPDVPKHQGITYFAFPMHQAGVEVRPLAGDDREGPVQRSLPDRCPGGRRRRHRWGEPRMGRGQHHAHERTGRTRSGSGVTHGNRGPPRHGGRVSRPPGWRLHRTGPAPIGLEGWELERLDEQEQGREQRGR